MSACTNAPFVATASTLAPLTKLVPVIVIDVCVFSITVGEIDDIVGLVSPIMVPPKDTAEPLIVIDELDNLSLAIEPANFALVTLLSLF